MLEYDLIIIGSGPAGSAAATSAVKAGLSVAVIDKATFPRDKLCGGLFTGRSEKAMRAIFGREISDDLFVTTNHMRFLSKGRVLADIPNAPPVHLTMRRDFDAMLHAEAVAAGATPYLGQPITELGDNTLTLKGGTTLGFKALIGADGVNSFVARTLFGRPFNPDTIGFGLEIESPRTTSRDDAVEVDFDAASWGYGWSFPKRKTVTVGVGGINSCNDDMKANMSAYVDQTGSDASLRYKGQYLPFGDYKKKPGRAHILLAGDAAGLVDPITGEGIALAMESGHHAAVAVAKALKDGQPEAALGHYMKLVKPIQQSLDQAKMWRMIMFPKATEGYFRKAFERGSSLQMKYLKLLAGEAEYADLRGALLRRIPKLGWRLLKHRLGFKGPA
ncbi:geranylgeranyl reductase family protein [Litoreibacter halocynthiae]|uniref:Geranylgeranyl reductase family protein n=1 Tax=Litoreibacter halocynthiae TaxID=1242689 RepID=A0A4R7LEQ8_9RHOB|nr:geranylgeranyl reductase family protein [Litoreibacter halocynthiae]TDT74128.1 geranylgeranyl reductase family protein [Litoreibacter halocynthiae]